jgi:hypothetical protein
MEPVRERDLKRLFVLVAASVIAVSASGEILNAVPPKICSVLADSGLKGRKWVNDYGDGSSGCASDYKDIGSAKGLANNLAFYVIGVDKYVMEVKLVLNYNQPSQPAKATAALLDASKKLSQRALGEKLPEAIETLIKQGETGSAKAGSGVIEVVREDWPTGKGYEVQVMMR